MTIFKCSIYNRNAYTSIEIEETIRPVINYSG